MDASKMRGGEDQTTEKDRSGHADTLSESASNTNRRSRHKNAQVIEITCDLAFRNKDIFDTPNRLDYYFKENNGFVHGE